MTSKDAFLSYLNKYAAIFKQMTLSKNILISPDYFFFQRRL